MAKKDKAKKEAKKARVAAKQEKVAKKSEKKAKNKKDADDSDVEDADLDAILAEYAKKQEQFLKVTEETVSGPSPRSASTFIASPSDSRELFLFGGEHYNGAIANFYNDLYIYRINSDEWRKVTSPNSPLPRSGHAMCRGGNTGGIYMFGGEFSSPKQGTFYHYNDFWNLDPSTREWTKIETKGPSPTARSGHRMVAFKRYIILFGGFQDTSQQTKYLNDLYIYDCQTFQWHVPALPPAAMRPDPRSSFSFLPHETGAILYGGYSRIKTSTSAGKSKGGRQASRVIMKPMVHQDTWFLRITPPPAEAPMNTLPTVRWEKRKKPVNSPNPARAGATMVHHKGRGIAFGGVHDVEEDEEGIDSEFFNQLLAFNIDRNRFFQLSLRKPRAQPAKKQGGGNERGGRRGRGKADEEELLRNLALIEGKGSLDDGELPIKRGDDSDDEDVKIEKPVQYEMPHPRFNAQLAVQDDTLYIYGGTFEKGDREFTFDEMHSIDLGKLDGAKEIFRRELEDWQGSEDEDSEDEDEDEDDEEDESEGEGETAGTSTPATSVAPEEIAKPEDVAKKQAAEDEEPEDEAATEKSDGLPGPRPFESLREFFSRTNHQWQDIILEEHKFKHATQITERSVKEIRKSAFERAEQKWWDVREEMQVLEDEQEAAGIGEVVALESRGEGSGGGGAGRRR
ncbi:galactose oxidase, partial [Aureobasidium melanogenum]|uniref:Galactose oxidase n=1 Tax=Aureobasidium melanogenum (strain CBS 110374) TaxID=1043003 RepID=A0A074W1X9_AURM1